MGGPKCGPLQIVVMASGDFKVGEAVGTSQLAKHPRAASAGQQQPRTYVIPPLACSFAMRLATGCALQTTILVR